MKYLKDINFWQFCTIFMLIIAFAIACYQGGELKRKNAQCTNQLQAAEGIIEAFKREGR